MKKFFEEFKKFALRGNVIDLAVGVVIGGVGGGDFSRQAPQKCISGIPGGGLQALLAGDNPSFPNSQGNVVTVTEIPDEIFIPVGFLSPEAMVKMSRGKGNFQFFLQQVQTEQQRHRIGAAAYRQSDPS